MNFTEIAKTRQSCRKYDRSRTVEKEKLDAILESARLAPSACNGQPYHITVCKGDYALRVARAVRGFGMNKFASDAEVLIVISEMPYVPAAAYGSKIKKNDYRSIDIGILGAYITAEATAQGLGSCIIGWLDSDKIKDICNLDGDVRLVISVGYPAEDDVLRSKIRNDISQLVTILE